MLQIKWIWNAIDKKMHKRFIFAMFLSAFTSLMLLINPTLTARLMNEVIVAQNPAPLPGILLTMLAVQVTRLTLRYIMVICLETTSQNMLANLRTRLFRRLQYQDMRFFDAHRTGDLMTRLSADVEMCRHFVAYIDYAAMDSVVMFVAVSVYLFFVNWKLALAMVAVTPVMLIITRLFSRHARPKFMGMRDRLSEMNTNAQENIAGNRVVKAFAREEYEKEGFDRKSRAFRDANLDINKLWLTFFPAIETLSNAMMLIALFLGAYFIMTGELDAGQLTIFTSLTWALSNPMRALGNLLNDWQRFSTCASKVMEVDMAKSSIQDPEHPIHHDRVQGSIEFRNVSFSYQQQPILTDVSFKVEPGKTLAVMGPTGSGKTTLIQLLARFYDVTGGQILVDGCDVRRWQLNELRKGLGAATQDVFLFSDTIEGNIAFGNQDLTEDEVHDFARRAAADEFSRAMSEGYDTIVGERGVGLSGGQKQRIALARALAMKPGVLIMDDTTSAVDMETEKYIQAQLRELPYACTRFIIAQRISSVKDADEILVLRDGRIAERGTHEQLLALRGYYYETYCLQNGIAYEEVRA